MTTRVAAVALATIAMAGAFALMPRANTWLVISIAGALALALCWRIDGEALGQRLNPCVKGVVAGLGAGVLMSVLTLVLYPAAVKLVPGLSPVVVEAYGPLRDWPGATRAAPLIALIVLAEECVWRGVLVEALAPRLSPSLVVVLASIAYALPQLAAGSLLLVLVALGCGIVWMILRLGSGGLVVPLVAHLVWSLTVFVIAPLE